MTEYVYNDANGTLASAKHSEGRTLLTLITADEFRAMKDSFPHHKEMLRSLGSVRYCKAEAYRDHIWGTLRIPNKNEARLPQVCLLFYMTAQELIFIEDSGELKPWVKSQLPKLNNASTPELLLLQFMQLAVENDILYLSHIEKELDVMEDSLLTDIPDDFFGVLTRHRRKLSELNAYYEQLTAMSDMISSLDAPAPIAAAEQWSRFSMQTERLESHVHLLQENVIQLRELYQAQLDTKQNKVMCILTVVTTLFLPLSLLTGWYGMNFANMPELHWRYAYPCVIAITVAIIVFEIIYFKKKKIL